MDANDTKFISNYCRTCMSDEIKLIPIIENNLDSILMECISIRTVKEDHLPQKICEICYYFLEQLKHFKIRCHQIDNFFKQFNNNSYKINSTNNLKLLIDNFKSNQLNQIGTVTFKSDTNNGETKNDEDIIKREEMTSDEEIEDLDEFGYANQIETKLLKMKENLELKKYQCEICKKSFKSKPLLSQHKQTHPETQSELYPCPHCGKTFNNKANLARHILRHNGEQKYSCPECQKKFYELNMMAKHCITVHNYDQNFKCRYCEEHFTVREQLERHERIHQTGKDCMCQICGKYFKTIKKHMLTHNQEKPFQCTRCRKGKFSTQERLKHHMEKYHSGNQQRWPLKTKMCHMCGKDYKNPDHILTHFDVKPFACEVCGKAFVSQTFLRSHMRAVHKAAAECKLCGKQMKQKNMNRHINIVHKNLRLFECSVCLKKFQSNSELKYHTRMHTDERPEQCDICQKYFRHKRTMLRHRLIHTGEKPHKCSYCGKSFNQAQLLTRHLQIKCESKPNNVRNEEKQLF